MNDLHLPTIAPHDDAAGPVPEQPRVPRIGRHQLPPIDSPNQLGAFVRSMLGFKLPRTSLTPGNNTPLEYLCHSFFENGDTSVPRDCIVWANRGGGKTQLGAIATLLDLIYKPGIQIRILGGSLDQSRKMYRYLRTAIQRPIFARLVDGNMTGRAVQLRNGSRVEVLTQSERSIRGERIHKLRCDEFEMFDPDVWDAAQMVTQSGWCGDVFVRGCIETLSTMHRPFGLMQKLVREARDAGPLGRRIFRWSVLDVLQTCPPERPCETCPLYADCGGVAKNAEGHVAIDDAIQQRSRVGREVWRSEMLCQRPSRADLVYPEFDPDAHVRAFEVVPDAVSDGRAAFAEDDVSWFGGIDFGYRAPTVLLWAFVDDRDVVHIVDEHVEREWTTQRHIEAALSRDWPQPEWIGADPAGHQRSEHTGVSTISIWKRAGWPVRTVTFSVEAGVRTVRTRLRRGDGSIGLIIHPRCRRLIEALSLYHYPPETPAERVDSVLPVKDGHDHAADALRYLLVNLDRGGRAVTTRSY